MRSGSIASINPLEYRISLEPFYQVAKRGKNLA